MAQKLFRIVLPLLSLWIMQSCEKLNFRSMPPSPIIKHEVTDTVIQQDASFSKKIISFSPVCTSQITTQAMHADVSKLTTDAAGNATCEYTPAAGFSGKDSVVITMTGAQNNGKNPNTDGKETIITTINITVQGK
jgi:hypothetical protein